MKQLEQQNQDDAISIMQEGTEKKLAEIKNDYAKRKAEIDKQEAEFKKKTRKLARRHPSPLLSPMPSIRLETSLPKSTTRSLMRSTGKPSPLCVTT